MAHLSGTFSNASAGKLLVTLSADFGQSRASYTGYVLIRGFIGPSGALNYVKGIDIQFPVSLLELDYPGGGVVWILGTETEELSLPSGVYHFGAGNITMKLTLTKR